MTTEAYEVVGHRRSTHRRPPIAIIGVPSSAGARHTGLEDAPRHLRLAGVADRLLASGVEVMDVGDLTRSTFAPDDLHPKRQNLPGIVAVLTEVRDAVRGALTKGAWPLVLGGDCTITIGVAAALASYWSKLGLLYLDADLDLNTPETSPSGIFDGMGLAHMLGRGVPELTRFGPRCPLLQPHGVAVYGYNAAGGGIDPSELAALANSTIRRFPIEMVRNSVVGTATAALQQLEARTERILLHFDVDVMDADDFPVADVRHSNGLGFAETEKVLRTFVSSPQVAGMVVTEFNPRHDLDGELARRLARLVVAALA